MSVIYLYLANYSKSPKHKISRGDTEFPTDPAK